MIRNFWKKQKNYGTKRSGIVWELEDVGMITWFGDFMFRFLERIFFFWKEVDIQSCIYRRSTISSILQGMKHRIGQ
ncbi:Interleukin-1 receptor type [Dirofilaria immitis]